MSDHLLPQDFRTRLSALILAATIAAACGADAGEPGQITTEREERGDTLIVTISNPLLALTPEHAGDAVAGSAATGGADSADGHSLQLVEELRIGRLDGREEYIFGAIHAVTADGAGGAYIFDVMVPALRHYDATGTYVRTLGGQGSGPGEYQNQALGLAVRPDGRIALRDPLNARLTLYHPDGTPSDHWRIESGLYGSNALMVDTAGHSYLSILLEPPQRNRPWNIGLLHLDENGVIVDSIPPPAIAGEPTDGGGNFIPAKVWARSPQGFTVVGVSDEYSFEIRHPDGRVVRVRMPRPPVPLLPEERAEHEALAEWSRTYRAQNLTSDVPDVPRVKPAYSDISAAADGRIWVRRHVTAEKLREPVEAAPDSPPVRTWMEPSVYDLFEPDGTYLGDLRLPDRTGLAWMDREEVWAIQRGEMDEIYLLRLRLEATTP